MKFAVFVTTAMAIFSSAHAADMQLNPPNGQLTGIGTLSIGTPYVSEEDTLLVKSAQQCTVKLGRNGMILGPFDIIGDKGAHIISIPEGSYINANHF